MAFADACRLSNFVSIFVTLQPKPPLYQSDCLALEANKPAAAACFADDDGDYDGEDQYKSSDFQLNHLVAQVERSYK